MAQAATALANARLLIVEDEPELAEILAAFFAREQARCLVSRDGADALEAVRTFRPDLVILDIKLPKRDGWSVLAELRGRSPSPPVLVASALGDDVDRLAGFRLGADDYIVKPFNPLEVVARAKVALRRAAAPGRPFAVSVGALRLDLDAHAATVADDPVDLTRAEFKMLRLLAERAGRLVSRGQLAEAALDEDAFDRSVNPHVSRIRTKIEPRGGVRIVSVRGEGYRLEQAR